MPSPWPLCSVDNPQPVNDGTLILRCSSSPNVHDNWDSIQLAFQTVYKTWIGGEGAGDDSFVYGLSLRFVSGVSLLDVEKALLGRELDEAVAAAERFLNKLIAKIKDAADWQTLNRLAEPILGGTSMAAGLLYGIGESLVGDVLNLLELGKLIVLAGIYERLKHWDVTLALDPVSMALAIAVKHIPWLSKEAKKCDEALWGMLHELLEIAKHPINFIETVGKHIWKGVVDDWNKLKDYSEDRSVTNDFNAGRLMGRALYQIVMMILLVVSVAGIAVKLAARFPWLMRLARFIKSGGKLAALEEAAGGLSDAAKVSDALEGIQGEGSARRAQSLKDLDAYEDKYQAKRDEAFDAGEKRKAGGYKAKVTEAIGERATTNYMETNYPDYVMDKGFEPGTGFDQVYTKYDAAGNPQEMMIVEAKGPGASLSTGANKGPQMSQQWVDNTVSEMLKSDNPNTQALGQRLQDALDSGSPPVTGKVIQAVPGADGAMGAQEIPLPNDPVYNGGNYN